ncbi:MAG: LacI family transcriptional regulator [Anaerolineaceae bacterium]|nr:LacI family transcriptional regulator [Anaerolineaceae bacterium]
MKNHKRVTIKQVAREAGVSTQTVSRVANEQPDVAPDTRKRVKAVITRLGYRPNAIARSLIQRRSYTLGIVIAGLEYSGPSRTLNGITGMAEELGYGLLLKELPSFNSNDVYHLLEWFLSRQVDGIIWAVPEVGDNRYWLEKKLPNLPIPLIFLTMENREGISIVSINNYIGGKIATEHLLGLGRQRIAHISGPLDWWESRQRKRGWHDALQAARIHSEDHFCVEGTWSPRSGERAFRKLLDRYPGMDAVFVGNDQMALSVLHVACKENINIPDELAVVGFDGIPEAAYFWPPLTTLHQNLHELGCTAVKELISAIRASQDNQVETETKNLLIKPDLIIRQSTDPNSAVGRK